MEIASLFVNVLAGVIFLALLWFAIFLILPVASIAGTESSQKARGWNLLFLLIMGFIPFWLVKGFSFVRDVLRGEALHASYWAESWNISLTIAGVGNAIWVGASWFLYLLGLVALGVFAFFSLAGFHDARSRQTKVLTIGLFGFAAYLGYLWGRSGKEWLVSLFI
jgi:hypothetical protein